MPYTYGEYQEIAAFLKEKIAFAPEVALILGTSLGPFAQEIEHSACVEYADIPHFLRSTAPGHAGKLIFGTVAGKRVVCMSGRFHSYEGYAFEQLALPVRVFKLLGAKTTILTNAAGAVNTGYKPGDIMLLKDHIKFTGASPLRGPNLDEFGPRFFDTSEMYTPELRQLALRCAEGSGLTVHEGVYFFYTGPQFETPAEIRAVRLLGGDVVGMSTVTEALTAAHCSMPLLAMSVVTNMAAGVLPQRLSSEEVEAAAMAAAPKFSAYVKKIIEAL
ncbi:purine-nucleoside phosphorylase [Oscillibacter hominis]|uniref:Purine nucleoside phosphorylase n=1 Tax=Oscillibacter hominis TaxID=2763056 RepID=A0A7G9B461_9FIRM|nr:purine-nucleoside phosphorylase [Oscillibacter hominis]QNL44342.1 purine-nucleoside phosphorylase [Oscillibacter hominis]